MSLIINRNLKIIALIESESVNHAISNLQRDIVKSCEETQEEGIELHLMKKEMKDESFSLQVDAGKLFLYAADSLGFIYGIYEISRSILGIMNFWFWNDQQIVMKQGYEVAEDFSFTSKPYPVRFRGWFVNDEVLLHTWSVDREKDKPWEMVFEALLRCEGNMIIPGTDRNSEHYRKIASRMGLYITHHHAEPLGAEMFARAYPDLNPSYVEHSDKFKELWRNAIVSQRHMKVIWNIGFRGQGDCPFWDNDPQYDTPESRGKLMSELIMLQYNMVKQYIPEAICCTNLYGETMELYNDGYLELPNDIIKIWADNGYGKMVTRRQNNHNPRIPSLPVREKENRHGVYYHVSFYDLQAANHITMLPNSLEFIRQELNELISHEVKDFWIINCSNVKPHVYLLDYIASAWKNGDIEVEEHREQYIGEYYGQQNVKLISQCFEDYPRYALPFGKHEDEHAGEQFSNHVMRILISQFMRNKHERTEDLLWATQAESLKEQIEWYKELCQNAYLGYEEYLKKSEEVAIKLFESERRLFEDSLLLQVKIHYFCFLGANKMCESLLAAYQGEFKKAFYYAGLAKEDYQKADRAMRDCEHGKWNRFYENECLTDVKQTAWVITGLMSYIRNLEDGPHYYQWQREFLYSEEDRKVMLIMNMENHLTDEEIFELMKEKWEF